MAFKITHSWIEDETWGKKTPHVQYAPYYSAGGGYGALAGAAKRATPEEIAEMAAKYAALDRGEGDRFRLYCDDGERCYEGIWDNLWGYEEEALEPLYDYGLPNAGCTRLDYYDKKERRWLTL